MARLMYYNNERNAFKEAFERKMTSGELEIVFQKLIRHFKLGSVSLKFTSGCRYSRGGRWHIIININGMSFGLLCHELAHSQEYRKYNKAGHNKRHWRIMKTMISYCKRKNYFEAELQKRLALKPAKPEPTKQEIQDKVIERLKNNCKRYQTKLKLYSNKLKRTQRRILRIEKKRIISEVVMGDLASPLPLHH